MVDFAAAGARWEISLKNGQTYAAAIEWSAKMVKRGIFTDFDRAQKLHEAFPAVKFKTVLADLLERTSRRQEEMSEGQWNALARQVNAIENRPLRQALMKLWADTKLAADARKREQSGQPESRNSAAMQESMAGF